MSRRRAALIAAVIAVALIAAGALAAPPAPAQAQELVSITDAGFVLSSTPINIGDSILWTNDGTTAHTTTSDTALWDSGSLAPTTGAFVRTFSVAGSFPYHCTIHPSLTGIIVVTDPATATTTPTTTRTPTITRTPTVTRTPTRTPTRTATVTATPVGRDAFFPVVQVPVPPTPTNTATATATPTNTPVATIQPPSAGIVPNGNFEQGHVAWDEVTDFPYPLITTDFPGTVRPRGGSWAVWLGGVLDTSTYISQYVAVSADRPYLRYWHWIASGDICGGYDIAIVEVNGVVADTFDLCNNNNTGGWRQRTIDMRSYIGQAVDMTFVAETDSTWNSNWFIDDVAFQASAVVSEAPGTTSVGANEPRETLSR